MKRLGCALGLSLLALLPASHAQDTPPDGFSWRIGPVDVHSSQTAKLVFANPFCSNPLLKMDVTVAFTDLAGKILQTGSGDATAPAKKRVILSCNDSVQIEISGYQITGNSNTVIGVLQIIPDLNGIPWVPVNVPLASVQVGTGNGRGFQPSIVLIPLEPVRRLILP